MRIKNTIAGAPVVVFSKTYCGYCRQVLSLFSSLNVDAKVLQLDRDPGGRDIQNELFLMTNSMTVPSVWIGGKYIGGCDATKVLHSKSQLVSTIKAAQDEFSSTCNAPADGTEKEEYSSTSPAPPVSTDDANENAADFDRNTDMQASSEPSNLATHLAAVNLEDSEHETHEAASGSVTDSTASCPGSRIDSMLLSSTVAIFSKTYCRYCAEVKQLFADMKTPSVVMELNNEPDGGELQNELKTRTGSSTVPSVWINGKFIGGCDDTRALHKSGKLAELLNEANNVNKHAETTSPEQKVGILIGSQPIAIFTKSYCPYCKKVNELFANMSKAPAVLEIDLESDGAAIKDELKSRTGSSTVPSVWIGGKYVGGCDDTLALHEANELQPLISEAEKRMEELKYLSPSERIEMTLASGPVAVFAKTDCPYSKKVKALFASISISPAVLDLDVEKIGKAIQNELMNRTGVATVPSVWIGGNYVGGCDDTVDLLQAGKLLPMISGAEIK